MVFHYAVSITPFLAVEFTILPQSYSPMVCYCMQCVCVSEVHQELRNLGQMSGVLVVWGTSEEAGPHYAPQFENSSETATWKQPILPLKITDIQIDVEIEDLGGYCAVHKKNWSSCQIFMKISASARCHNFGFINGFSSHFLNFIVTTLTTCNTRGLRNYWNTCTCTQLQPPKQYTRSY